MTGCWDPPGDCLTVEPSMDDRFHYPEQRFATLGLLRGVCVSLVHTETLERIHIISFRKAIKNEQIIFFQNI